MMFQALIGDSWRPVEVLSVGRIGMVVAFGEGKRLAIPYNRFRWLSDDWYEVSRKMTA